MIILIIIIILIIGSLIQLLIILLGILLDISLTLLLNGIQSQYLLQSGHIEPNSIIYWTVVALELKVGQQSVGFAVGFLCSWIGGSFLQIYKFPGLCSAMECLVGCFVFYYFVLCCFSFNYLSFGVDYGFVFCYFNQDFIHFLNLNLKVYCFLK